MTSRSPGSWRLRKARSLTAVPATTSPPRPGQQVLTTAGSGPVVGSLCTGYGGLDLGVLAALGAGRVAWCADSDPHVSQILAMRMPDVPNLGDIRRVDWAAVEPVDIAVLGFPCKDISVAGRRAGIEKGEHSGIWTDCVAGIRLLRPALVIVENVAALRWRNGGLHRVLGDLAEAGYDALWRSVRAADIGAAHRRERVFLLAWLREPDLGRGSGDAADADRTRRLLQWHQRRQQTGRTVATGPTSIAAPADGFGREELHAPQPTWWPVPTGTSAALGGAASPGRHDDGTRRIPADAASDGRDEGLPSATRLQGRPDAALGDHPPARPAAPSPGRRQQNQRHLVAVPNSDREMRSPPGTEPAPMNWGVYEPAIRRWEALLDRPAPHPTQPGNHGRPVLAPAFVEHLMGLPQGWVTDLPLPRTAQLRATHAVALLLEDFAELLRNNTDTGRRPQTGQEATAA